MAKQSGQNPLGGYTAAKDAVVDAFAKGGDAARKLAEAIEAVAKVTPGLDELKKAVAGAADLTRGAAVKAFDALGAAVKPVTDAIGTKLAAGFRSAYSVIEPFASAIGQKVGAGVSAAGGVLAGAAQKFAPAVGPVKDALFAAGGAFLAANKAVLMTADAGRQFVGGMAGLGKSFAEAGEGILRLPFQALNSGISAVQANVAAFVGKLQPAMAERFGLAVDNLYAAIGQSLLPVLDQFTRLVTSIGGAFNGLTGEGQRAVAAIAAGTVGLIAFGAAMTVVQAIATGGIGPLLGAVVGAIGGVLVATTDLSPVFDALSSTLSGVMNAIGGAIDALMGTGGPLLAVLKGVADTLGGLIAYGANLTRSLAPAVDALMQVGAEVVNAVQPLIDLVVGGVMGGMALQAKMLGEIVQFAAPYIGVLARAIGSMVQTVVGWVKQLLAYIGVTLPELETPKGAVKDPTGLAARGTSTQDVSSVLQSARESAFKQGWGGNAEKTTAPERTASAAEAMKAKIDQLEEKLRTWITVEGPSALAAAIRGQLPSLSGRSGDDRKTAATWAGGLLGGPFGFGMGYLADRGREAVEDAKRK